MSHVLDEKVQRTKPDTIVFTINNGEIDYDNGNSMGLERGRVWVHPGGQARFSIQNNDANAYDVRIPFNEFEPFGDRAADTPREPINEPASGRATVNVQPRAAAALTYVIKPAAHFPFPETPAFLYKYTVYYTNTRIGERRLDPDLEVSP